MDLATVPVTELKGVGSQLAIKLEKLGIYNCQDLLLHLPLRYEDRTRVTPIGSLQPMISTLIEGEVRGADVVFGRRRSLMVKVQDNTGLLTLRFFHFSKAQQVQFTPGRKIRCFGEVRRGSAGLELYHPEYQWLDGSKPAQVEQNLTPVYPITEGVTQARLRKLSEQAIALLDRHPPEELLAPFLSEKGEDISSPQLGSGIADASLKEALKGIHHPPADMVQLLGLGEHPWQLRLALEELVAHHLGLLQLRQQIRKAGAIGLPPQEALVEKFLQQLPFSLTGAQQRVVAEVADDLSVAAPMLRLVQGDVGSGKTVVAALAAITAMGNGYQAAFMAPTELLAEQHYQNMKSWLEPLGIQVAWLAGKLKGKARESELSAIANGEAQLVVGTHALFQEDVIFHNLALAIIDEQHRFGVHQRLALREKGKGHQPHQLIMTATPIPRTLAMSFYADLDCSVIDELPPGRTPVQTVAIDQERRGQVIERVRAACNEGRQAYWVCTLIEESEHTAAQAAEAAAEDLRQWLPELNVGLVHGRMKPKEKAETMAAFKAGELHLLVATTVIEVGVDVPNASVMVIENPERLGLAQLHQLRGRVGRGAVESFCVLVYQGPLSKHGQARLQVMRETNDGFVIAEEDLKLRGPGELLGTRQTGDIQFRIADLQNHAHLLPETKRLASEILQRDSGLAGKLIQRWVGERQRYAEA